MKQKVFKFLCVTLAVVGLLIMFGTAGSSDCREIGFMETVLQITIGLILTISGVAIGIVKEV